MMQNFGFVRAGSLSQIWPILARRPDARLLGGGTNLVDLMRENLEKPAALIDVTGALSAAAEELPDGGLRLGAAMRNSHLASDARVLERYPVLSQAILNGASAQLRNMATTAGNLMQRTRCYYFYDATARCNKRTPGAGCDAIQGHNRIHSVLGASDSCIAVHPSDMCVALAVLDATVVVRGPSAERRIPFEDFHRLPGSTPDIETDLKPGEVITAVDLPAAHARRSLYRKVRDRASYAFALVSVAAVLELDGSGRIEHVRIALGGVAPKPWRARRAEQILRGAMPEAAAFAQAMDAELAGAKGLAHNAFKIPLAKRTVVGMLGELMGGAETGGAGR
jgi:xanthine dehydrogenase YagS FAD-binding subunit